MIGLRKYKWPHIHAFWRDPAKAYLWCGGGTKIRITNNTLLSGQTIMEMLVVFFIISIGLYAAVALVMSNVTTQEYDADHIVAMNMAREMLELAQNKRDSNWLEAATFDEGMLNLVGGCTAVPHWDGTAAPYFDIAANISDPKAKVNQSDNLASPYMFTNQSGSSTRFARLLTFAPICAKPDHSETSVPASCVCPAAYPDKIGLRAKADIQWITKGRTRKLSIYTDLYDWK